MHTRLWQGLHPIHYPHVWEKHWCFLVSTFIQKSGKETPDDRGEHLGIRQSNRLEVCVLFVCRPNGFFRSQCRTTRDQRKTALAQLVQTIQGHFDSGGVSYSENFARAGLSVGLSRSCERRQPRASALLSAKPDFFGTHVSDTTEATTLLTASQRAPSKRVTACTVHVLLQLSSLSQTGEREIQPRERRNKNL